MLIFTQDKDCLLNIDKAKMLSVCGFAVVACGEGWQLTLGKYESPERAKDVLDEIAEKYSEFRGTNGGPLLTQPGYVQPMLFEPPKVYEMPPRAGEDPDFLK